MRIVPSVFPTCTHYRIKTDEYQIISTSLCSCDTHSLCRSLFFQTGGELMGNVGWENPGYHLSGGQNRCPPNGRRKLPNIATRLILSKASSRLTIPRRLPSPCWSQRSRAIGVRGRSTNRRCRCSTFTSTEPERTFLMSVNLS